MNNLFIMIETTKTSVEFFNIKMDKMYVFVRPLRIYLFDLKKLHVCEGPEVYFYWRNDDSSLLFKPNAAISLIRLIGGHVTGERPTSAAKTAPEKFDCTCLYRCKCIENRQTTFLLYIYIGIQTDSC